MQLKFDWIIRVGNCMRTVDDFCAALRQIGCRISGPAQYILDKTCSAVAGQGGNVQLVVRTTSELVDHDGWGKTTEVFAGAARLGLEQCHTDDGLWLRLQYLDQPPSEWLMIGMEPANDSDGDLSVYGVGREGDVLYLTANCANPNRRWEGDVRWVFRLPKSS